jgi:hypothetical protein
VINVHLWGNIWMCKAVWPHMQKARYGRIVNITSGSFLGQEYLSPYTAAKAGIFGVTRTLAIEGAEYNIKCNSLGPTAWTRAVESQVGGDIRAYMETHMTREAVTEVVGLLAHEECPVTGQCIIAGGGRAALLFLGETHGYVDPQISMESLRDNFDKVMDRTDYHFCEHALETASWEAQVLGHGQEKQMGCEPTR